MTIKNELIKRSATARAQRVRQFIKDEQLGERTPSQFLRHVCTFAGTSVQDDILCEIWSSRLPSALRPILAVAADKLLDQLAEAADEVFQAMRGNDICGVARTTPRPADDALERLTAQMGALLQEMAEMGQMFTERRPCELRSQSRDRRRSQSRSSIHHTGYCWYHNKFGSTARVCKSPCDFSKNG